MFLALLGPMLVLCCVEEKEEAGCLRAEFVQKVRRAHVMGRASAMDWPGRHC